MSGSKKTAPKGGEKNRFYERTPYFLLFAAALQLILGFLLLAFPNMLSGVLGTVGVALLVMGAFLFLRYFLKKGYARRNDYSLSFGLLMMIAALGVFMRTGYLMLWVPGIMGVLVVVTSMVRIQCAVDGLLMKGRYWFIHGITAIAACVMAYFLVSGNTVYVTDGMVDKYVCIVLLLDAVFNIVTTFLMYVEGTGENKAQPVPDTSSRDDGWQEDVYDVTPDAGPAVLEGNSETAETDVAGTASQTDFAGPASDKNNEKESE